MIHLVIENQWKYEYWLDVFILQIIVEIFGATVSSDPN